MSIISDETIKQAAKGDHMAFELIYRTYSKFVFNVARRVANTSDASEEITQEVFICLYRKLHSFNFKSSFKTWVYRITMNTTINYLKKNSKQTDKNMEYDEHIHIVKTVSGVEEISLKEHNEKIIATLLDALNEDQRVCVVLRNMEGLSYQEIATSLDININTVRSRLKRAREVLIKLKNEVITNEL